MATPHPASDGALGEQAYRERDYENAIALFLRALPTGGNSGTLPPSKEARGRPGY